MDFKEPNPYRLIFREEGSKSYLNLRSILHGYNQDIHNFASFVETGTINSIHNLVIENVGLSFVYKFVVQKNLDRGVMSQIYINDFKCKTFINYVDEEQLFSLKRTGNSWIYANIIFPVWEI